MAEGFQVEGKSLEELESEITCGICQEHYTEPKILPCLHYYCKQCILTLAQRSATSKPFSCPECRCAATLPEGGVDQLKTAFFINRLKSKVTTIERVQGKVEVKCELCVDSTSNAEAFCRQCAMFICKECVLLHNKLKIFRNHDIASLDDLKHGRARSIPVKESSIGKCEVHEKSLKIFCFSCDSLICRDCIVKQHKDHNFEFTKEAATDAREVILNHLKPLKELHTTLIQAAEKVNTTKEEVEAQKISIVINIDTAFKELCDILSHHKNKLIEEASSLTQQKIDKLSVQEKNLSLAIAEIQSVMEYTERCMSLSTDNEVMSMHTEMGKKIQGYTEADWNLEPVEVADIRVEVRCAEAMKQLCQAEASISRCIMLAKCSVDLPEHFEVGTTSIVTLVTRLHDSVQAKGNCKISSQIKSLHNGVITDCNIDEDGSGRYSIQCTPTVRGRHELTVLIDGQHVAGSPFPVYVSIHPTHLGKPIKVWGDMNAHSVFGNSKGEIVVAETKKNIYKIAPNGHIEKFATVDDLVCLRGIACDKEDVIYCIDEKSNSVFTCDNDGKNGKVSAIELDEGVIGRGSLYIANDEVMVSEMGLEGIIKIYSRDLKLLRTIEHENVGLINGLSSDLQGNIYATDFNNFCIQVFNSNGDLVHSIEHDDIGLERPWGVCVSGQYVYVTDVGSHCVFVFTTDGEYVTSFGQKGTGKGEFNCPYYIHVDRDGFVFVCDTENHRVQHF